MSDHSTFDCFLPFSLAAELAGDRPPLVKVLIALFVVHYKTVKSISKVRGSLMLFTHRVPKELPKIILKKKEKKS